MLMNAKKAPINPLTSPLQRKTPQVAAVEQNKPATKNTIATQARPPKQNCHVYLKKQPQKRSNTPKQWSGLKRPLASSHSRASQQRWS
jgi:hypothetical protein